MSVEKYLKVTKKDWYQTKKIKLRSINFKKIECDCRDSNPGSKLGKLRS